MNLSVKFSSVISLKIQVSHVTTHFYSKRLIKHALFIPRVNSNVLGKENVV